VLINGFVPDAGQTFNVFDWSGHTSAVLASMNLPVLTAGLVWDTSQFYSSGLLSVALGLSGDFNKNGVVDAADYTVWRDGRSPHSNQAGYNLWKANFGKTAGSGASLANVPEPSTLLLSLAGFSLLGIRRR
jgi:hypothetical protein